MNPQTALRMIDLLAGLPPEEMVAEAASTGSCPMEAASARLDLLTRARAALPQDHPSGARAGRAIARISAWIEAEKEAEAA